MRIYIFSLVIGLFCISCRQEPKLYWGEKQMLQQIITMKDSLPKYPHDKQIKYIVFMRLSYPYEFYLDDILIRHSTEQHSHPIIELNPYLLENGKHKIRVQFPAEDSKNLNADDEIYFIRTKKDLDDRNFFNFNIENYTKDEIQIFDFKTSSHSTWEKEIEITELPYQIRGWNEGEDLSKWNQIELEQKVIAFYKKLRILLNNGEVEEFMNLSKFKDFETTISIYDTPEDFEADIYYNKIALEEECKGNMLPIEKYKMKLYGDGKLVKLENAEGEFKNYSVLASNSKKYGKSYWGVMLYKPKNSNDFIIIRR